MRSLICVFTVTFLFVGFAHAGHVEQIKEKKLPQDERIVNSISKVKKLEPYVENWVYEWNFKIGKDEVIDEITTLDGGIGDLLRSDSLNGELLLYSGLVAHYAYNLDLQEYWDSAEARLMKAGDIMKDDFRPDWFLALHYVQSQEVQEGMNLFLEITRERDIENGLFWEDYALSAYFSQMLQNVVMGLDKAKAIHGKDSQYEKLFGRKIRKKIVVPGKNSRIGAEELWTSRKSDSLIDFVSFPLGYRVSIPGHWKVSPSSYQNKAAGLTIELEPVKGMKGDVISTVTIFAHVAEKKETIEDFVAKFMKRYSDLREYEIDLGLNELSYIYADSNVYSEEGGARLLVACFERDEPRYRGVRLEEPQESSNTSGDVQYRALNADRLFTRFKGKMFYLILLDCTESIFEKSLSELNGIMKSFRVD